MAVSPEPAFAHGQSPTTAVVLCNLGTPEAPTPAAVRRYLAEFLSDPRVVEIPRLLWLPLLHAVILRVRPARSARKYASIWTAEGSPLKVWTEKQAVMLGGYLGQRGERVLVRYAMRYGSTSMQEQLDVLKAEGTTPFQKSVAHAYGSPEGLGGTQHHVGGKAGPASTAYLGVFRRERLIEVGLFDEGIKRGQDWELNRRLRATGGIVWFTPELTVTYRPRANLRALVRQFVATGIWRGELARRFGPGNSIRYFVPPLAVLGVLMALIVGIVGLAIGSRWLLLAFAVPASYLVFVIVASVVAARGGLRTGLWYLVVLPCIHFGWGIGFLLGYLKLTKNITEHTGR